MLGEAIPQLGFSPRLHRVAGAARVPLSRLDSGHLVRLVSPVPQGAPKLSDDSYVSPARRDLVTFRGVRDTQRYGPPFFDGVETTVCAAPVQWCVEQAWWQSVKGG